MSASSNMRGQAKPPLMVAAHVETSQRKTLAEYRRMQQKLRNGCHACEFDEAEGGIINHCADCRLWIVRIAYELFA